MARVVCEDGGYRLPYIPDAITNDDVNHLRAFFGNAAVAIGLNRANAQSSWVWETPSPPANKNLGAYQNWHPQNVVSSNDRKVFMDYSADGTWYTELETHAPAGYIICQDTNGRQEILE